MSKWLLEWDHRVPFTTKLEKLFTMGIVPFPCSCSTNLIGFQEHFWQWFPFCKEPDKWTTSILIFFHIGCTWLGVCGSTSSDFLEFNKIGIDYNILSVDGYQTWVRQYGTAIIPSALSCFTSERNLGMTEIRGNA